MTLKARAIPVENLLLLQEFEQGPHGDFAAFPYRDPTGHLTDGWGHLIAPEEPKKTYPLTKAQADTQGLGDLAAAADQITTELGQNLVASLKVGQWAALLDFTFNEGIHRFVTSTMFHFVRTGLLTHVADEFPKWVYGTVNGHEVQLPGLVKRRAAERDLWLS